MKRISIVIPTYNEEKNITLIVGRLRSIFQEALQNYNYEIIFIDNYSTDNTREKIRMLSKDDKRIKAIFNAKNYGFTRSTFYGLTQARGDCAVLLFADMQDPPEIIIDFVKEWEMGNKIVIGIKNRSKENKFVYFIRKLYYKFLKKVGEIEHIEQFTGFGLYDVAFINIIRNLDDPLPYLRGIVAELGYPNVKVNYEQQKREYGRSSFNFMRLYDTAMLGITSYTKVIMRIATICGFVISILSIIVAFITLLIKLFNWSAFDVGIAAISIGIYFFGAVILFFVGFLGEYIINMNIRVMKHPLVIEEQRINFDE